jgi:hypothetical protein
MKRITFFILLLLAVACDQSPPQGPSVGNSKDVGYVLTTTNWQVSTQANQGLCDATTTHLSKANLFLVLAEPRLPASRGRAGFARHSRARRRGTGTRPQSQ